MLSGVNKAEGHQQRVGDEQRPPPFAHARPGKDREQQGAAPVQRRNGGDQVDRALALVEHLPGHRNVQCLPSPVGQPLDVGIGARMHRMHRPEQPVGPGITCAEVHAHRIGRIVGDVNRPAGGRGPRRRGRDEDEARDAEERHGHEPQHPLAKLRPRTQPKHARHDVGHEEERHVGEADNRLPPRRMAELEVLLQPHGRHRTAGQEPVGVDGLMP